MWSPWTIVYGRPQRPRSAEGLVLLLRRISRDWPRPYLGPEFAVTWGMRILSIVLFLSMSSLPAAEARRHNQKKAPATAAVQKRSRIARDRLLAENARAEAELTEVRSGHVSEAPAERDFPTQQADDAEVPRGAAPRR